MNENGEMFEDGPAVPDDAPEDWNPEGYTRPGYDDPGDFDEREDGCS